MSITQLGRYKIVGTLGRGAMGTVYQAHDPLIEREVAIKAISCAGLSREETEEFEQRFFREAKSAGRLNHPNIVTIHDVGRSGDLSYIAMEFLVGHSLRDLLDAHVTLPVERIVRIAAEIADGLAFAHAAGIVHRDIKPSNIMVLDSGAVKITDFGIAQLPSSSLTLVGTAMGTPKYMSPEQVNGHKADGRSDIFSLGALLYEMLTGRAPFSGAELNAILYQVLNVVPPAPSSVRPELPPGFDRIVARAMEKDANNRYASATDLAADLRRVRDLPGLSTPSRGEMSSPPTTSSSRIAQPGEVVGLAAKRGSKRRWAYGVAIAATLAALWAGGSALRHPATPPAPPAPALAEAVRQDSEPAETRPVASEADNKPVDAVARRKTVREVVAEKARTRASANAAKASGNWLTKLRADLDVCSREPFYRRFLCVDKARRQYCPGHWGDVSECAVSGKRP